MTRLKIVYKYFSILNVKSKFDIDDPNDWKFSISDSTSFYLDAFRYYFFKLPYVIKNHKRYFRRKSRGFGENAFHTMWYLLYRNYRFKNFLEIGVYRGQIMHLIALLAKLKEDTINIYGISPFNESGDVASSYLSLDYLTDITNHFHKFGLNSPTLVKAHSTDPVALKVISSRMWDCIYIDGSHDFNVVIRDWENCSQYIKVGGIIVMDDSSLYTNYKPPFFAFAGHPGPSKVSDHIHNNIHNFVEVLRIGHNRVFEKIF